MNLTVAIPLVLMEKNFVADVEVSITARSRDDYPGEPGEGCEWELVNIYMRRWKRDERLPDLYTPKWLDLMIEESDDLAEAITVAESNEPRGRANT